MKKIFIGFISIFPYLFFVLTYLIFKEEKIVLDFNNLIAFAIMAIIMITIFLAIYSISLIFMIFKWKLKTIIKINLLVKFAYIPVHFILFLTISGMANPFLFAFMAVPFVISIIFMGITGIISLISIIKTYRKGIYKLSIAIIYALLSYCYISDIIIAIIVYVKFNKYEKVCDKNKGFYM